MRHSQAWENTPLVCHAQKGSSDTAAKNIGLLYPVDKNHPNIGQQKGKGKEKRRKWEGKMERGKAKHKKFLGILIIFCWQI